MSSSICVLCKQHIDKGKAITDVKSKASLHYSCFDRRNGCGICNEHIIRVIYEQNDNAFEDIIVDCTDFGIEINKSSTIQMNCHVKCLDAVIKCDRCNHLLNGTAIKWNPNTLRVKHMKCSEE